MATKIKTLRSYRFSLLNSTETGLITVNFEESMDSEDISLGIDYSNVKDIEDISILQTLITSLTEQL